MTKQEAIDILLPLQQAVRALNPNDARWAFIELLDSKGVATMAQERVVRLGSSLNEMRSAFEMIEASGSRFPSN
jgi:hypothetical protein